MCPANRSFGGTMLNVDAIQKAIAAHTGWKGRLRTAVTSGKSEVAPGAVAVDNGCDFGRWLYGSELSAQEKGTESYRKVKELHAQFHKEAAKVLELAVTGQKDKAAQLIGLGGNYSKISHELTDALVKWRESLR